jgi:hypothetical protein
VTNAIEIALDEETRRALPAAITGFAKRITEEQGATVLAVLFYGSTLRTGELDGMLDFYVIVDRLENWRKDAPVWPHLLLPPRVEYWKREIGDLNLRAKLAIVTLTQFERLMRRDNFNTTIWARFCQPSALAYEMNADIRGRIIAALAQAVVSAASWAALLGPVRGRARDFWSSIFEKTYSAEIRVETAGRPHDLVSSDSERYKNLLPLAWDRAGIAYAKEEEMLRPSLSPHLRSEAKRAWRLRALLAKPLNLLRLIKAAFTFADAADYAAWKIERHTGVKLELTEWQRRHPILAAPPVLWRLWRKGLLR